MVISVIKLLKIFKVAYDVDFFRIVLEVSVYLYNYT